MTLLTCRKGDNKQWEVMVQDTALYSKKLENKCTQVKEEWFNEKCAETERINITVKFMNKILRK